MSDEMQSNDDKNIPVEAKPVNDDLIEEKTADGSPTLYMSGNRSPERMHHSAGAASETIYVYGDAVLRFLAYPKLSHPRADSFLVLGLGLGYIELLICLLTDFNFKKILSYEKEPKLREHFMAWARDGEVNPLYERVLESLIEKIPYKISSMQDFRLKLSLAITDGRLLVLEALNEKSPGYPCDVICFDAFSSSSNEDLWQEFFLQRFMDKFCADICFFSTYAKTGTLTRTLKAKGFTLVPKDGFSGKRECTLAIRP